MALSHIDGSANDLTNNKPPMHLLPTSPTRRRRPVRLAAALLFGFVLLLGFHAQAQYSEYDVKAAFLFNFVQFVKWPGKPDASGPITIGILGDDPFGGALESAVQGQSVGGRRIAIKRSRSVDALKGCQLVFISKSEKGRVGEILGSLQGTSSLTVGETEGFTRQGGMIGFTMEGGKVRFEINSGAAQRAGLEISSRLLRLAK
jgi:uncharacterized protein DUF4154